MFKKILPFILIFFCQSTFAAKIQDVLDELSVSSTFARSDVQVKNVLDLDSKIKSNILRNALEKNLKAENLLFLNIENENSFSEIKESLNLANTFLEALKTGNSTLALSSLADNDSLAKTKPLISKQIADLAGENSYFALADYAISDRAPVGIEAEEGDFFLYLNYLPMYKAKIASRLYITMKLGDDKIAYVSYASPKLQAGSKQAKLQSATRSTTQGTAQNAKAQSFGGSLSDIIFPVFEVPIFPTLPRIEGDKQFTSSTELRKLSPTFGSAIYSASLKEKEIFRALSMDAYYKDFSAAMPTLVKFVDELKGGNITLLRQYISLNAKNLGAADFLFDKATLCSKYTAHFAFLLDFDVRLGESISDKLDADQEYLYFDIMGYCVAPKSTSSSTSKIKKSSSSSNSTRSSSSSSSSSSSRSSSSSSLRDQFIRFAVAIKVNGGKTPSIAYLGDAVDRKADSDLLNSKNKLNFKKALVQRDFNKLKAPISSETTLQDLKEVLDDDIKFFKGKNPLLLKNKESLAFAVIKAKEFISRISISGIKESRSMISNAISSKPSYAAAANSRVYNATRNSKSYATILDAELKTYDYFNLPKEANSEYVLLRCYLSFASSNRLCSNLVYIGIKTKGEDAGSIVYFSEDNPDLVCLEEDLANPNISMLQDEYEKKFFALRMEQEIDSYFKRMGKNATDKYEKLLSDSALKDKELAYAILRAKKFIHYINNNIEDSALAMLPKVVSSINNELVSFVRSEASTISDNWYYKPFVFNATKKTARDLGIKGDSFTEYVFMEVYIFKFDYKSIYSYPLSYDIAVQIKGKDIGSIAYLKNMKDRAKEFRTTSR